MITREQLQQACDAWDTAEPGSAKQHNAAAKVVALVQSYLAEPETAPARDAASSVTCATERRWQAPHGNYGFGFVSAQENR